MTKLMKILFSILLISVFFSCKEGELQSLRCEEKAEIVAKIVCEDTGGINKITKMIASLFQQMNENNLDQIDTTFHWKNHPDSVVQQDHNIHFLLKRTKHNLCDITYDMNGNYQTSGIHSTEKSHGSFYIKRYSNSYNDNYHLEGTSYIEANQTIEVNKYYKYSIEIEIEADSYIKSIDYELYGLDGMIKFSGETTNNKPFSFRGTYTENSVNGGDMDAFFNMKTGELSSFKVY